MPRTARSSASIAAGGGSVSSCARCDAAVHRFRVTDNMAVHPMKLSLCNEVIRELAFERQCALVAGLGYAGLEVAPFTFGDDAWRMPIPKRADIRKACADAGIAVSGLHWLLAAPAGLSITTADRAVWRKSVDILRALIDLCAEL